MTVALPSRQHHRCPAVCRREPVAGPYEGRPGHGHIFIGGGLGAVSRTRAARHPERYAVFVGSGCRAGAFEVEAAYPPASPPTVNGTTPCYPGELQRDDIPVPEVLRAD